MTTILLIGASGQVGAELSRALLPLGTLLKPGRAECDLSRPGSLGMLVDQARPHIIVNAAAYTAVDQAEQEPGLAMTVNADAPEALAIAARRHGALLVHYSTDYVFDGNKSEPYVESDATHPSSAYGRSKAAGEDAIRNAGGDYLIFRASWVHGASGKNFLRTILRLAAERDSLRVVSDQIGAPTWARLIAQTTSHALRTDIGRRRSGTFESGLFHLTAAGACSWHGFAETIVAAARSRHMALKCREIIPVSTAEYPLQAVRPMNSRLSCALLETRYGIRMPGWETTVPLVIDELQAARA